MKSLPADQVGWLAGARDSGERRTRPASSAAIPSLVAPGSCRGDRLVKKHLAERFARLLGRIPLAYLARWRMQLAARKLETTKASVLQIALDVGYELEAAFCRAFKREFDLPPARYRKAMSRQSLARAAPAVDHSGGCGPGPPRFRHDPFARDMASDPGGAMAPCDGGTTHVAFGAHAGLGLHNVVISWLNPIPHAITVYVFGPRVAAAPATLVTGRLATPYPDRTFTRWIAPASPGAPCADP